MGAPGDPAAETDGIPIGTSTHASRSPANRPTRASSSAAGECLGLHVRVQTMISGLAPSRRPARARPAVRPGAPGRLPGSRLGRSSGRHGNPRRRQYGDLEGLRVPASRETVWRVTLTVGPMPTARARGRASPRRARHVRDVGPGERRGIGVTHRYAGTPGFATDNSSHQPRPACAESNRAARRPASPVSGASFLRVDKPDAHRVSCAPSRALEDEMTLT